MQLLSFLRAKIRNRCALLKLRHLKNETATRHYYDTACRAGKVKVKDGHLRRRWWKERKSPRKTEYRGGQQ